MPESLSDEAAGTVGLSLETTEYSVPPGGNISIRMIVENRGEEADSYQLSVSGLPNAWASFHPSLNLEPGMSRAVSLTIAPPAPPQGKVGTYPFDVKAVSEQNPGIRAEAQAVLIVADLEVKGRIGLLLESTQYAVAPGEGVAIHLVLTNQGLVEDHLSLSVEGIPAAWVTTSSSIVHLLPGEQREVSLTVRPPRSAHSKAGRRSFKLSVNSREDPDQPSEVIYKLLVGVFNDFRIDLRPEVIRAGQSAVLTVANLGNVQDVYQVSWESPSKGLVYEAVQQILVGNAPGQNPANGETTHKAADTQEIVVPAGETAALEFLARPRRSLLFGREVVYPYTVRVQASNDEVETLNGEVSASGAVPVWVIPVVVILFMCLLCSTLAVYYWRMSSASGDGSDGANATQTAALAQTASASQTAAAVSAQQDSDGDGLTNAEETERGTNPNNPDTDGDQLLDGEEVKARGTNPLNPDTDSDGLTDGEEVRRGTDPLKPDTDADSLGDGDEVQLRTDPLIPDTDGDGLSDGGEIQRKTDPLKPDTDGDAWRDGDEVRIGSNPLNPDSDSDRLADGKESPTRACPDPLNPDSDGDGILDGADLNPCDPLNPSLTATVAGSRPTQPPAPTPGAPTPSPVRTPVMPSLDGVVAFESNREADREIFSFNTANSAISRLTNSPGVDTQPSWSPNGERIAFTSRRDGNNEIYVMNDDGTSLENLTENPADDQYPTWSPNGQWIAFTSNRDGNQEIYIMRPDGSELRNLTGSPANDFQPTWFTDRGLFVATGEWIAFTSDRNGNQEIYLMGPDGSNQKNLTNHPGNDFNPAGEPGGTRIAFLSDRDGNLEIFIMEIDGGAVTNLTRNPGPDEDPAWSPDADWIAFSTNRSGSWDIYIVSQSGSQTFPLIVNSADDRFPNWR